MNKIFLIGAGGVGSWLCPSLCLLTSVKEVCVIDGDKLEKGNLDRQLFTADQIGQNKAKALAARYKCGHVAEWFNTGSVPTNPGDWLIVAVDNDAARKAALETCDIYQCRAIVAANEVTSAEAYIYLPQWKGSALDPRTFYPGLLTNTAGDPQRAALGCTGQAQEENRQLVSANYMAAALAQHLFVCWALELPKMEDRKNVIPHLPHRLAANLSRLESIKVCETLAPATAEAQAA